MTKIKSSSSYVIILRGRVPPLIRRRASRAISRGDSLNEALILLIDSICPCMLNVHLPALLNQLDLMHQAQMRPILLGSIWTFGPKRSSVQID